MGWQLASPGPEKSPFLRSKCQQKELMATMLKFWRTLTSGVPGTQRTNLKDSDVHSHYERKEKKT